MSRDKKKNRLSYSLLRPISNEKWQPITIPLFSIIISFITAAIVILLLGKDPLQAFYNLLQGSGILPKASYAGYKSMLTDFLSLLNSMTPLVFAS